MPLVTANFFSLQIGLNKFTRLINTNDLRSRDALQKKHGEKVTLQPERRSQYISFGRWDNARGAATGMFTRLRSLQSSKESNDATREDEAQSPLTEATRFSVISFSSRTLALRLAVSLIWYNLFTRSLNKRTMWRFHHHQHFRSSKPIFDNEFVFFHSLQYKKLKCTINLNRFHKNLIRHFNELFTKLYKRTFLCVAIISELVWN